MGNEIVYIVDSDDAVGEALATLLHTYGIPVSFHLSAESLERTLEKSAVQAACIVLEVPLPDSGSLSLLRVLRGRYVNAPVIVTIRTNGHGVRRLAVEYGATDVLEKPFLNCDLVNRILSRMSWRADRGYE